MRISSLKKAETKIVEYFDQSGKYAFTFEELSQTLYDFRSKWGIAKTVRLDYFIQLLKENGLNEIKFQWFGKDIRRFNWRNKASDFQIIQAIKPTGYFNFYSAMEFHGLTDQIPEVIYFNSEQSSEGARGRGSTLTQEGIDRAFSKPPRRTKNVTTFQDKTLIMLNGMNTDRLGVISTERGFSITDPTRTLIDSMVRPQYCGGPEEVLEALKRALDDSLTSTNQLLAYLKKLDYVYPYHQVMGFYLDHLGVKSPILNIIGSMEKNFDFYLYHDVKNPTYNEKWRLYVPSFL